MKPVSILAALTIMGSCLGGAWAQSASAPAKRLVAVAEIVTADASPETLAAVEKLSTLQNVLGGDARGLRLLAEDLRVTTGLKNLVVNWPELKALGLSADTPITYTLRQVSGAEGLRAMLEIAAPGKLDFYVAEGVVEVHSRDWLSRPAQALPRVYDPGPMVDKGFYDPTPAGTKERREKLAEVLRTMAAPTTWEVKGNLCKAVSDKIAVVGPARAHWEVSGVYDEMRHPTRIPVTKAEANGNLKSGGEPVNLPARLRQTAGYRRAADLLAGRCTGIRWRRTDVHGATAALAAATGLNVLVEWQTLGLARDAKVPDYEGPAAGCTEALKAAVAAAVAESKATPALALSPEGVVYVGEAATLPTWTTTGVFDVRDLAKRKVFEAATRERPTYRQIVDAILEGLGKAEGGAKFAEFEGLVVVRGTPEQIRDVSRRLAGLAK